MQDAIWGWDKTNKVYRKILVDTEGKVMMVAVIDELSDIGDVDLAGIADDDVIYWDAAAGKWKPIAHLGMADAHHNEAHDLASHSTKAHAELSDAPANAHHVKYTDANAVSAVEAAGLALASGKNIRILSVLTSDHTWSGLTARLQTGTACTIGQAKYVDGSGKMQQADADSAASMPAVALATQSIEANVHGQYLLQGFLRDDTWDWTPGGLLYPSLTPGALTQDVSGYTTGDQVQVGGIAIKPDIIYWNPSLELVEIS